MSEPQTTIGESINPLESVPTDKRRVGIEIEVEGCTASDTQYWKLTHDDSLRAGGQEFVSYPIPIGDVDVVLGDFYTSFHKYSYVSNQRTGVHVHVDVRDFTLEKLAALTIAYVLVEPALMHMVGLNREENIYCVPWYRADSDVKALANIFYKRAKNTGMKQTIQRIRQSVCKYSGLYLEPIGRFGTVEFRHAPTWKSKAAASAWVNSCYRLVEFAKTRTPSSVMQDFLNLGCLEFATNIFEDSFIPPLSYEELVDSKDVLILAEVLLAPWIDHEESESNQWFRPEPEIIKPEKKKIPAIGDYVGPKFKAKPSLHPYFSTSVPHPQSPQWVVDAEMDTDESGDIYLDDDF